MARTSSETIYLTTVTPVYRGAHHLDQLVSELKDVRDQLARSATPLELIESIFVDDASTDGSTDILSRLADENPWIRVLSLSRNFGQHPATVAGVLHSSGDWVATLDEDLQHRPRLLLPLIKKAAAEGLDLVYAQPQGAVHGSFFRNATSRTYKALLSLLTSNRDILKFNSFRMIRGSVARAAAAVSRRETYFDVALGWFTDRIAALPLPLKEVRTEKEDKSGYSFGKLINHAGRLLLSSEIKPLRVGGLIGGAALALSLAGALSVIVLKLVYPELIVARGWSSILITLFFFGGLISLLTGIALEYISDLHLQALGRPTFFVIDRTKDRSLAAAAGAWNDE